MTSRTRALACAVAAALAATLATAAPATAAPTITVDPRELDRGADATVPYVAGGAIVDGATTIRLPAANAALIGVSGDDYVVWSSHEARTPKVWRVDADGDATLLLRSREAYAAVLSTGGDRLVVPQTRVRAKETVLTVYDVATGAVAERTSVPGFASVLDVEDGQGVVGTTAPARTWTWDLATGVRERVSRRAGYQADLSADRLAVFDGDPYRGGCSVVSTLSDPATVLSRSCTERVEEFSPDGRRMALVDLLTDGLGPNRVTVRAIGGRRVVTYDAPYYFGLVTWERPRSLLLQTFTTTRGALVRCVREECERASRLGPAPEPHPTAVTTPGALAMWRGQPAGRS